MAVPSNSPTNLIVEDYKGLRRLICEILKEAGYQVSEAANGEEGLSRLREQRENINVTITDLAMPEMDGHALAERLRQARPDIKIIFMSADPDLLLERVRVWETPSDCFESLLPTTKLIGCVRDALKPA